MASWRFFSLTINEWQKLLFDLSLAGSNLLALVVILLTFLLIARKLFDSYWNRYKQAHQDWLMVLMESYINTGLDITKDKIARLTFLKRFIFKQLLLKKAETSKGKELERISILYEAIGFSEEHLKILRKSPFWWKRAEAVHQLGHMMIRRSHDDLLAALNDKSIEVRLEATWPLGHMGFVEDLPKIVGSMSYFFKIAALRMDAFIFDMGKPVLPLLLDLCKHPEVDVRLLAIHLVGEFKDSDALGFLIPELNSPHLEIRLAACKAIGSIGDKKGLRGLIPFLKDETWQMRSQTAKQFFRNKFDEAIPDLMNGLEDKAWWMRYNAGEALSWMGKAGKEALLSSLQSTDRFARDMAAQWLDEIDGRAA